MSETDFDCLEGWVEGRRWRYGTAGFRGPADEMPFVAYRCGVVASLRALETSGRIGLMVTASHNPVCDNGIKLVEQDGSMLTEAWEAIATDIVNATHLEDVVAQIKTRLSVAEAAGGIQVTIGRDTRPTSQKLSDLAAKGVDWALRGRQYAVRLVGIVTTPILHWVVWRNASAVDYYQNLREAYFNATKATQDSQSIVVDCANGVGMKAMKVLQTWDKTSFKLINVGEGTLNHECGADFLQKQKRRPSGLLESQVALASLDGDADRLILATVEESKVRVVDGDRIAVFIANYIQSQMTIAGLIEEFPVTVVQTAYANGASTQFLKAAGVKVICTKTGIKHLEKAAKLAAIAVYFEANGHGSVYFSESATSALARRESSCNEEQKAAKERLRFIQALANPVVGDAIADLLLISSILAWKTEKFSDMLALYSDLASIQIAVNIQNRHAIVTTDLERSVSKPPFLQPLLDDILARSLLEQVRCFVRPSGTEDVVRVYLEGDAPQETVNVLADEIVKVIRDNFSV